MTSPVEDITRLTELQAGMLFHAAEAPGGPDPYTVQITLELEGTVDAERWRRAVVALVAHHSALRTLFVQAGADEPVAVVRRSAEPPWTVHELGTGPEAHTRDAAHRDAERARRFALDREIPFRAALHRLGEREARLVLTLHHLVVDGWSVPILLEDLVALHAADGDAAGLPASPRFGRYLEWLDAQDPELALAAWQRELAGVEPLRLATGSGAPAARPRRTELELDEGTVAGLGALAERCGATRATVLQLAWGLVLARLAGRTEAVLGSTVSGRPPELAGVERAVGLFVNTVPLRVPAPPQRRVGDALRDLAARSAATLAHQHVGLPALQRRLGHGALFDTTLVVENLPGGGDAQGAADAGGGTTVVDVDARDSTHYPLTVVALPGPRWRIRLEHHPDLLDPDLVGRLATTLDRALRSLATAAPDDRLGGLALVDEATRAHVRALGRGPAMEVAGRTLPELLAAGAERHPHEPAVVCADGTALTFADLHGHARRVARALLDRGVGPDRVVALVLPRGPELMVALVAVQRAGAAHLPLDPEAPPGRRQQVLDDAAPVAVLVAPDASTANGELTVDLTADLTADPAADPAADPDRRPLATTAPCGAHLAYVLYTSGSTGRPKGVGVSHAAVVNRLAWMQDAYPLAVGDRVLQKTPATFDVSVWELFWPLLHGAAVVLAAPGEHRDPAAIAARIVAERVGTVHFVPTMLEAFLDALDDDGAVRHGVDAVLRRIVCSGEGLPPAVRDRALRSLPSVALHNLYGPTEAAVDVTAARLAPGSPADVPIGAPVANTGVRVLDASLAEVAPEVVGELYLTGVQLARGYRGRPGLTGDRFVADPSGPPGTRMYRTGDLARWGSDGLLRHVGRVDDQVKIRGQRVEPGETEAVLAGLAGVRAAAVVAVPDHAGAASLVAYVVLDGAGASGPEELRAALAEQLPGAQVPAAIVELPRLPVGAHGKLDRSALPAPQRPAGRGRAPRTPVEAAVCAVFASALDLPRVGADDDFFALGGHSLLVLRVVAELTGALGTPVDVPALLAAPTAAALAARLAEPGVPATTSPLDPLLALRPGGDGTPLFCVHPAAGLSWCYLGLLPGLDPGTPVWGLQAPDLTAEPDADPRGIGERAAEFIVRIRTVRPHGPYLLLGWSVGGRIAHEMASRLEAMGEEVELLVVLDAYPHTTLETAEATAILDDARAREPGREPAALVRDELGDHDWLDDATAERILDTYVATTGALVGAEPGVVRAPTLVFHAEHPPGSPYRPEQWHAHVAGELTYVATGGRHEDMGRPEVLTGIARAIDGRLADRRAAPTETAGAPR